MIKTVLVVAASFGVSAVAIAADQDSTPKPYHVEPIPVLQPFNDEHCLRETGSRITRVDQGDTPCISANGRVYENNELGSGGAISLGDVLRRDPSITMVSGGHR